MKITKTYLRQVIQEELSAVMSEADAGYYQIGPPGETPSLNKDAGEISDIEGKLADFEAKEKFEKIVGLAHRFGDFGTPGLETTEKKTDKWLERANEVGYAAALVELRKFLKSMKRRD